MKQNLLVLVVLFMLAFCGYGYGINVIISSATTQNECIISVAGSVVSTPKMPATAVTIDFISPSGQSQRLATNIPLGANGSYQWNGSLPDYASVPAGSSIKVTTNRQVSQTAPLAGCSVSYFPMGSYLETCKDVKVTLTCQAQKEDGSWVTATYDITNLPNNVTLANMNGVLVITGQ